MPRSRTLPRRLAAGLALAAALPAAAADRPAGPPGWVDPFPEGVDAARPATGAAAATFGEPAGGPDGVAALLFLGPADGGAGVGSPVEPAAHAAAARVSLGDLLGGGGGGPDGWVPGAAPARLAASPAAAVPVPDAPETPATAADAPTPGFGRFCPVAVRDGAALVEADPAVWLDRDGVRWRFADDAARTAFRADPLRYLPAVGGEDVVLRAEEGFRAVGRAELAVRYRGRLFLFRSAATRAAFAADPLRFVEAE